MIKLFKSIVMLAGAIIYYTLLAIYVILRLICWPVLGRPVRTVKKIAYIDRIGPDINKPQTFVNKLWSKIHKDDKLSIKSDRNAKTAFRLGIIMTLESVGTDPKLVESIAECVELK